MNYYISSLIWTIIQLLGAKVDFNFRKKLNSFTFLISSPTNVYKEED